MSKEWIIILSLCFGTIYFGYLIARHFLRRESPGNEADAFGHRQGESQADALGQRESEAQADALEQRQDEAQADALGQRQDEAQPHDPAPAREGNILSHDELSARVEDEVLGAMTEEERGRGRELAVELLREVGEQIRETGGWGDYRVHYDHDVHWLVLRDARALIESAGWYAFSDGRGGLKLSSQTRRQDGPAPDLPSPRELRSRIVEELRAAQSESERGMARKLAVSALAEVKESVLRDGNFFDLKVSFAPGTSWLVLEDVNDLIRSAGWFLYGTEEKGVYKIEPDKWLLDDGPSQDLPSPRQIRNEVESEIRSAQSEKERGQAESIAQAIVERVHEKWKDSGPQYEFEVEVPDNLNWLVMRDLEAILRDSGWSMHRRLDSNILVVSRIRHGSLIFI